MSVPMTLPGDRFADAWLNVWLATSDDDERPQLDHTVLIEFYDRHVRLVATDSFVLLGSTVGDESTDLLDSDPLLEEAPVEEVIVVDHDARMPALMRFVAKDAKAASKAGLPGPTVRLDVRAVDGGDTPTLAPELDRRQLVVSTEKETLTLDTYEGVYPQWRSLLLGERQAAAVDEILLSNNTFGPLSKIRGLSSLSPARLSFAGPLGLVRVDVATEPPVFGAVMPVRESDS